jgi:phage/plasmid-associated DNA primase
MREHIRKVICSGNSQHDDYLMNWLARLFQHPEEPVEVAVVMRGAEGVGKGLLGRFVAKAFGLHGMQISSAARLVGNFNAHLRDLILLFADEAFFAGDRQHEGRLRALISEETLTIEGKYQNVISVRNMLHIIMASNADWVIPASLIARRWFMLDVANTRQGDFAYFAAIVDQMEYGGLAAMVHDLLHRAISNFNPRDVPKTDALAEQQVHSLDSLPRWWHTVYRSRHEVPTLREWCDFDTTELLRRSYLQWCDETRANRRQTREDLGKFMNQAYQSGRPRAAHPVYEIDVVDVDVSVKLVPNWLDKHAVVCKEHQIGYTVGTLEEARVAFTTICDIPIEWGVRPGG